MTADVTPSRLIAYARLLAAFVPLALLASCQRAPDAQMRAPTYTDFTRSEFNQRAAEHFLPLFWRADGNNDHTLQPGELSILWGYGDSDVSHWVRDGKFTVQFLRAYQQMLQADASSKDVGEQQRRTLVVEELDQGRPVLVATSLQNDSTGDASMVRHVMLAAQGIERIYAAQKGVTQLATQIPSDDLASKMLFYRNQGPFCEAPRTENNPACSAFLVKPARIVGLYPAEIQANDKFCELLAKAPNAAALMDHFSVVRAGDTANSFKAVPFSEAFKPDMQAVASELDAGAQALGADEAAFKAYLAASAQAFRDNDWEPANRAWVAMSATNSKWYARIGPDEVYYEPCAWKAGFALQLARINRDSLAWQKRLDPLKNDMEHDLAQLAGKPYRARQVQFKLPDFIDVVLNAGDQRNAHGATIGQSLPNWGPVAKSGGRTVAMTNLYTDADSQAQQATLMSALFCMATNRKTTTGAKETLISTLLHEAAHNLGPSHEYQVNGKVDAVAFGGPLAATLEELKAQTSSMYLTQWLSAKGIFSKEEVEQILLNDVAWAFGHISRGMYGSDGTPRNYSQLAAIQIGSFMDADVIHWKANEKAANGNDQGCMEVDFDKLPGAVQALEKTVLQIKATNNKPAAEQLLQKYVDDKDGFAQLKATITEHWLRAPRATFVYSVSE